MRLVGKEPGQFFHRFRCRDTIGSIFTSSTRAALYGMSTTSGIINSHGVVPISRRFDILGPLAKHLQDGAIFLDAVVDLLNTRVPEGDYLLALGGSWDTLRIGFLDPEEWFIPDSLAISNPRAREQLVRYDTPERKEKKAKILIQSSET
ncbi:unnamed protein product [Penicillium glandicola]